MAELNPVLVKELRGRMRGPRAFVLLTVYLTIIGGLALLVYLSLIDESSYNPNIGQRIGQTLFFLIGGVALAQVCLITPMLTAGSISGEKERQSYDLLVSSLLTPWQIVWGKLGAAMAYAGLLVLGTIPLISVAFLFGGVGLSEVIVALIALLVTALLYASVGLYWSSVVRSSMAAAVLSLGTVLLVLLGLPLVFVFVQLLWDISPGTLETYPTLLYLFGAVLSYHPFIALYMTEGLLRDDQSLFYIYIDMIGGQKLLAPSPWLAYVAMALLSTAVLLLLTVRRTRPDLAYAPPVARRQPKADRPAQEPENLV